MLWNNILVWKLNRLFLLHSLLILNCRLRVLDVFLRKGNSSCRTLVALLVYSSALLEYHSLLTTLEVKNNPPFPFRLLSTGLQRLVEQGVDVKALRAFRVLRPLRLVSGLPSKSFQEMTLNAWVRVNFLKLRLFPKFFIFIQTFETFEITILNVHDFAILQ